MAEKMLINYHTGLVREVIPRPKRHGKTAKYKANGGLAASNANKAARTNYQNASWNGSRGDNPANFPFGTCNGKKSQALRSN